VADDRPRTPSGLSPRARRLWREVTGGWELDADQLAVLEAGCRALTRMRAAEAQVADEGLTSPGSKGQPRPHPLLAVVDTERRAFLAALKQLDLERDDERAQPRNFRGQFGDLRGRASRGHGSNVTAFPREA
jgi:phage terminase small subunit